MFKTIYADPPWAEHGGGKIQRGADKFYPLMSTNEIISLRPFIDDIACDDCHLYLWVTNNFLEDGLRVVKGWGFKYITTITWLKGMVNQDRDDAVKTSYTLQRCGLGQYFRGLTEHCLFAKRGKPPYKTADGKRCQGRTGFIAERTEHSEKPEQMRGMIELVSYSPFIELFARKEHKGWEVWGNEVET